MNRFDFAFKRISGLLINFSNKKSDRKFRFIINQLNIDMLICSKLRIMGKCFTSVCCYASNLKINRLKY